jgi:2-polyprenyl-3-methyl-5-hydroxy-6-metoxy-1,4-benzoquinol methylase
MMNENEGNNRAHVPLSWSAVHLAGLATRRATSRQRRIWSRRVTSWDRHGSANLGAVTSAVIAVAAVQPGANVLDLGCGTGQISIPLARRGANVLGVDVSPAMASTLNAQAYRRGLSTLTAVAMPVEELDLPPASLDLIVSSYALHHLRDADKARLVTTAFSWLRPGGRLVIADMMLGRGGSARDRAIIRGKLKVLARKGPGGWWRIVKNAGRYLLRVHERPISMTAWMGLLETAGFTGITASAVVAEAGLVTAARTGPSRGSSGAEPVVGTRGSAAWPTMNR